MRYEIIDHGIEHSEYFQGCGVAFTEYTHCATGIGNNFKEALSDALEQIAYSGDGIDVDRLDQQILKDKGLTEWPTEPEVTSSHSSEESEIWYHVSIRYCLD